MGSGGGPRDLETRVKRLESGCPAVKTASNGEGLDNAGDDREWIRRCLKTMKTGKTFGKLTESNKNRS